MRKFFATILILVLCFVLAIPSVAANDEDSGFSTTGDNATIPVSGNSENLDSQITPATPDKPVVTPPAPTTQPQQETPTTTPTSTGGSFGGGGGGYASPIVNIEAIEVPLADGTTIVLPFLDVPQDAYYTAAVAWAYSHDPQITGGVADDRFDPLATCTRGQMVTFLWRAAGCPEPTGAASTFSDVAAGAYYEKAVAWAVENGITTGMGDGKFQPDGIVNRAQTVTFLYRAKGSPAVTAGSSFTDVASGTWYENAVAWAVASGVTDGVGNNAFAPNNNCVRGQTVTFLYRAYK